MEALENPILTFKLENNICYFDSIWKEIQGSSMASISEVVSQIEKCKTIIAPKCMHSESIEV